MASWQDEWVDYYEVLGAELSDDKETIKKKYRDLCKFYHPDMNPNIKDNTKIQSINEAYKVLSDEEMRKIYDEEYIARMNGEYQEDEYTEEVKYTDEEMHQKFSEQEIRQAKRESFLVVVNEELEKAKIIVDAKNELLFAGYTDELVADEYYEALKEFVNCSNEYILSLEQLYEKALSLDLIDVGSTIREIVDYLDEVVKSVPTNATDAKVSIEISLIKEQLKEDYLNDRHQFDDMKNRIDTYFLNIKNRVISRVDYEKKKRILLLDIENLIIFFQKYVDLLTEYEIEDIDSYDVSLLVGRLEGFKYIVDIDYNDALDLAERIVLKKEIKDAIEKGKETQRKTTKIYKIIKKHPVHKKREFLINYAHELISNTNTDLNYLRNKACVKGDVDKLLSDILSLTEEAKTLYEESKKLNKEADDILNDQTKVTYNNAEIIKIVNAGLSVSDKMQAIKLLQKATRLFSKVELIDALNIESLGEDVKTITDLYNQNIIVESTLTDVNARINEIISNFNIYNDQNPQSANYMVELSKKIRDIKDKGLTNKLATEFSLIMGSLDIGITYILNEQINLSKHPLIALVSCGVAISSVFLFITSLLNRGNDYAPKEELEKEFYARMEYYELVAGNVNWPNIEDIYANGQNLVK